MYRNFFVVVEEIYRQMLVNLVVILAFGIKHKTSFLKLLQIVYYICIVFVFAYIVSTFST